MDFIRIQVRNVPQLEDVQTPSSRIDGDMCRHGR